MKAKMGPDFVPRWIHDVTCIFVTNRDKVQAVGLAGHWLDLWKHPEDEGCKILKGVRIAEEPTVCHEVWRE